MAQKPKDNKPNELFVNQTKAIDSQAQGNSIMDVNTCTWEKRYQVLIRDGAYSRRGEASGIQVSAFELEHKENSAAAMPLYIYI